MTQPLLKVEGLRAGYSGLVAVRDVSFEVFRGDAVAIVGPNGAGKSTTLNTISGGIRGATGSVMLEGKEILRLTPEAIALRGVSLVPEGRHVFPSMTVRENLMIGSFMRSAPKKAAADYEKVLEYFPRLRFHLGQAAGKLSGGEQQMLVLGRALMTQPKILLIDEPSLGLAPRIIDEVYDILLTLRRDEGLTLLINEQNSNRVLKFLDQIYILRDGAIQMHGKCADLRDSKELSHAYFGTSAHDDHEDTEVDR